MITFQDMSYVHFLDSLAEEYRLKGLLVHYMPFVYGADFLPLAASASQGFVTVIDHDADFVLVMQTFTATEVVANINAPAPNILVQQTLETSGRRLQDRPAHILNIFGTALRPHILSKPLVLPARTTLRTTVQDLAALAIDLRLSFIGCKAYLSNISGPPGAPRATSRSANPVLR